MQNWTQKKQLFTITGVAAAVCLLAAAGVWYAEGQIEEVGKQVEAKRQEIVAAEAKISQIPEIEKDVIVLRENLDQYVKILPDTRELNAFVRMLNQFEDGVPVAGLHFRDAIRLNANHSAQQREPFRQRH